MSDTNKTALRAAQIAVRMFRIGIKGYEPTGAPNNYPEPRPDSVAGLAAALQPDATLDEYAAAAVARAVEEEEDFRIDYPMGVERPLCPAPDIIARLRELAAEILPWAAATFPKATLASIAEHLRREANELAANPTDAEEMADVFFLLVQIADRSGQDLFGPFSLKTSVDFLVSHCNRPGSVVSPGSCLSYLSGELFRVAFAAGIDLPAAVAAKLAKNQARKWGAPDAQGVVEHVE